MNEIFNLVDCLMNKLLAKTIESLSTFVTTRSYMYQTFIANLLKSECRLHSPKVTVLWDPIDTTTKNSA